MAQDPDYSTLVAKAEAAIQNIADPELRRAAFNKVLDKLIAAERPVTSNNLAGVAIEPKVETPITTPSDTQQKHATLFSAGFGLMIAILIAATQIPRFYEVLKAAAEGRATIALLRGVEKDLLWHFAINWIIWSIIAWLGIRYIRPAYKILRILNIVGISTLALVVIVFALSALGSPERNASPSQQLSPSQTNVTLIEDFDAGGWTIPASSASGGWAFVETYNGRLSVFGPQGNNFN